jgi:ribosomal protein L37AE/L43A
MKRLNPTRLLRKLRLAYVLRCARDDVRTRRIRTPAGVWACHRCQYVSLSLIAFDNHLVEAHA